MTTWDEIRKRFIAAVATGDVAAVVANYHPDAVLVAPEGRFEGPAAIEAYWRAQLAPFSDRELVVVAAHDQGDTGVGEWVFAGTHTAPLELPGGQRVPPTRQRVRQEGIHVAVEADGLLTHDRFYYDLAGFLAQLGLLPETAG